MEGIIVQNSLGPNHDLIGGFKHDQEREISSYTKDIALEQIRALIYTILDQKTEHCYPLTSLKYDTQATQPNDKLLSNPTRGINKNAGGPKLVYSRRILCKKGKDSNLSNDGLKSTSTRQEPGRLETASNVPCAKEFDSECPTSGKNKDLALLVKKPEQRGLISDVSTEQIDKHGKDTRVSKNAKYTHFPDNEIGKMLEEGLQTQICGIDKRKDNVKDARGHHMLADKGSNDTFPNPAHHNAVSKHPPGATIKPMRNKNLNQGQPRSKANMSTSSRGEDQSDLSQQSPGCIFDPTNRDKPVDEKDAKESDKDEKEDKDREKDIQISVPIYSTVYVRPNELITEVTYDNPCIR